ncbi:MAG: hypothetical protein LBP59_17580 [Planctomycetaceae bacterium]|nr:hypothetical protein [Planctomycetaceae bacterium]
MSRINVNQRSQISSSSNNGANNSPENVEVANVEVKAPVKRKRKPPHSTKPLIITCIIVFFVFTCIFIISVFYRQPVSSSLSGGIILPAVVEYAGIKNIPGKRFAGIESTRTYKSTELTAEIKKVLQAAGLPNDVFAVKVPADKNLAVALKREFKLYHDNHGEFEQLRKEPVFVNGAVNNKALTNAAEVLARVDSKRLSIREMLDDSEQVAYSFEMINIEGIGDTPDISSAGYLDDYVLLEEYAVARAVKEGKIRDAVIAIAYVFRIAQLTAEAPNLPVRYVAAQLRIKALDLIQNTVFADSFIEEDLSEFYLIVLEQLETWSEESKAFIGYRASGMKTFNLILAMGIDYAFEQSELDELAKRDPDRFSYKINQNWAWDHVFFLQSMQTIIGECSHPYYERRENIEKILNTLNEKYDTPEELITSSFLLREMPKYMQFYAVERAKCELAALVMATSLKNSKNIAENTTKTINDFKKEPLTGKEYHIRQIINETKPKINVVWGSYFGNMKPFRVPDYSKNKKEKTKDKD